MSNQVTDPLEPTIADTYLICNDDYRIAICRQCAHGVKFHDIIRHLTDNDGPHRLKRDIALQVFDIVQNDPKWNSVSQNTPTLPDSVEHPIPGIKTYKGFQCTMRPKECRFIARKATAIRHHWCEEHQLSKHKLMELTAHGEEGPMRRMDYHRVFLGGGRKSTSQIGIRQPGAEYAPKAPPPTVARVRKFPEVQVPEAGGIIEHLTTGQGHSVKRDVALRVSHIVRNSPKWNKVSNKTPVLPAVIEHPIPGLAIRDGFQCTMCPKDTGTIRLTADSMRKHWNDKHRLSAHKLRKLVARGKPKPMRRVACQRLFLGSNAGSHHIHIRQPGAGYEPEAPTPTTTQVAEGADMLLSALAHETQEAQSEPETHPGAGYEPASPPAATQVSEAVEESLADRYFIRNEDYGIIICRQCAHGIKPRRIVSHLTNIEAHSVKRDVALQVSCIVRNSPKWNRVSDKLPAVIEHPIPGLTIRCGYQCTMCPKEHRTIRLVADSMRKHWYSKHQLSAHKLRKLAARGKPKPMRRVACQRLFLGSDSDSHYILIRQPGAGYEPEAPTNTTTQVAEGADMSLSALAQETQEAQSEPEIHPGAGYEPASQRAATQVSEAVEESLADRYFIRNDDYGIIICRQCAHGVKFNDIVRHLSCSGGHNLERFVARQVFDIVQNDPKWNSVSKNTPMLPDSIERPIPGVTVLDGFQCMLCPRECRMVVISMYKMRNHWADEHQLSTDTLREMAARGQPEPSQRVVYQRVFRDSTRSSVIYIRQPGAGYEPYEPEGSPPTATQAGDAVDMSLAAFALDSQSPEIKSDSEYDSDGSPPRATQAGDAMNTSLADRYFIRNDDYGIIICRQCAHGIKPSRIVHHLTNGEGHGVKRDVAQQVSGIVQNAPGWNSVSASIPVFPTSIEHPIPGVTIQDGFQCTMCPKESGTIRLTADSMRKHWNNKHRFNTQEQRKLAARGESQPMRRVAFQQVFLGTTAGSRLIHIRQPGAGYELEAPTPTATQVAEAVNTPLGAFALESQSELEIYSDAGYEPEAPTPTGAQVPEAMGMSLAAFAQETQSEPAIQPGHIYGTNPWVDRTAWATYLRGRKPTELRTCIQRPKKDAAGDEGTAQVIWHAVLGVARKSQSITKRTGHFVRVEAARTDMATVPSKPLQEYMETVDELERHIDPWRRILMFFARTQVRHDWNSPVYRFSKQQRTAWDALWHSAECHKSRPGPIATNGFNANTDALLPVEACCMTFIVELLDQRIRSTEYESALVCALAVLGVSDHGASRPWKDPHNYHPILSSVINVSRFIVVHQSFLLDPHARELSQLGETGLEGEWDDNSPLEYSLLNELDGRSPPASQTPRRGVIPIYPSSSSSFEGLPDSSAPCVAFAHQARYGTKTCLEWIRIMVAAFMVRGTSTPMEWMLEFHQHGMKIHQEAIRLGLVLDDVE
ncbi:hypothetical protein N7461_005964 [Penicillium sp. DV-2018c]|nr:hypothetical protein N7461_005964 [Penicillium sp. DV-2018c]